MLEIRRVELVRQVMNICDKQVHFSKAFLQFLPSSSIPVSISVSISDFSRMRDRRIELQGHKRQSLSDVVMKFTGNTLPFVLACMDQPSRQTVDRYIRAPPRTHL